MKYLVYIKGTKEMLNDPAGYAAYVKHYNDKYKKKELKNSLRLINPIVTVGEDFEDHVKNLVTIRTLYDAYKIPRIIKNLLIKREPKRA